MRRYLSRLLLAISFIATVVIAAAESSSAADGVQANFEGRTIDLADGWGDATACASTASETRCFRSEPAMDRWLNAGDSAEGGDGEVAPLAACSTSLRLYDGTSYSGQVLYLSTRNLWLNLSNYGFDNLTSSYKVGACGAYFAENSSGGGAWYPGSTAAGAQAATMATGWNNRISSVYLQ